MGSIIDITQCPRCGFNAADTEYHLGHARLYIFCDRCGYLCRRFFNREKDDLLKGTWDWEVNYPTGSYICRRKGENLFTVDSIQDGSIEDLLEHLDEYDVCKYTFYEARCWYIKDLHSNTTTLFSEHEYRKCTVARPEICQTWDII